MTPDYTLTGNILEIGETVTRQGKNGKTYYSRELVVEKVKALRNGNEIRQPIKFEMSGEDYCAKLDKFKFGDAVEVAADVNGREWKGKHFVNLTAWKIVHAAANGEQPERRSSSSRPKFSRPPDDFGKGDRLKRPTSNVPEGEDEIPF